MPATGGKVNAAATPSGDRHNRDYARHLDALGEDYSMLDRAAMRDICGSNYYSSERTYSAGCKIAVPGVRKPLE